MDENTTKTNRRSAPMLEVRTVEEAIGWTNNAVVTGISFTRKLDHWIVAIKAEFAQGPRVAFVTGNSLPAAIDVAQDYARRDWLVWKVDRWPVKRQRVRRGLK